jgi:hypothetical protein
MEKLKLSELEAELSKFSDLESKAFDLPTIDQYMEESFRIWELKKPLLFQKYKLDEIVFGDEIDKWGDVMTLKEFIDCCESGGFIDYDGTGYYANSTHESNIPAIPSMISDGMIINRPELTHVVWFNK